jgi:hypothetical protein
MAGIIFRGLLGGTSGGGGGGGDTSAWLQWDASAITGVADGATLPYTAVLDQSGNGRNAVSVGFGITAPTYAASGLGIGKPGMRFPGSASFEVPDMSALTEVEFFGVVVRDSDTIADNTYAPIWKLGGAVGNPGFPANDGVIYDESGSSSFHTVGNPSPNLASPRLVNVISTSSEWTFNLDTTQLFTTATNTVSFPSGIQARFGGASVGSYLGFVGHWAEFRIYATKRTSGQRAAIESALKTKWGLTGY